MMSLLWFGLHQTATGFKGTLAGRFGKRRKNQDRVNVEANEVDPGSDQFLSCFVKPTPITNFVNEVHLQKLSVLAGNRTIAVAQPAVASLAAWGKATSKVHGLKVGAWYARAGGASAETCFNRLSRCSKRKRWFLPAVSPMNPSRLTISPHNSQAAANYSPYQIVNVANGAIEGDSTEIVVTVNL
jgi:hypothetical protein